jgi:glycosyltransferase involved in cell wall biosynthesis
LEAMASGRAIVSTGKGAEGLVLSPSYDIWIADRVDSFTSAIARLIEKPHLRKEMGERAVETIDARYDWKCIRSTVETLLAALYESEGSLYGPADPGLAPK